MRRLRRTGPLLLAALLLGAALTLPPVALPRPEHRYLVVLDISQSMNVRDASPAEGSPSRLELARAATARLVRRLPCGGELGLALFSGHRCLLLTAPVEVCAHRRELEAMVARLDWTLAWEASSEVAEGLFDALAVASALQPAPSLVFVTDGHEAPPVDPRYRMRFPGEPGRLPGLLAGVGGDRPVPIPRLDRDGRLTGYWQPDQVQQVDSYSLVGQQTASPEEAEQLARRIRLGTEHLSFRHAAYLDGLAAETGLQRLHLRGADGLARRLERADLTEHRPRPVDLRWIPALAALLVVTAGYRPRRGTGM